MKKILALILALAMCFALVACGETAAPATETKTETTTEAKTEEKAETKTEEKAETTTETKTEAKTEEKAATTTVSGGDFDNYPHPVVKDNLKIGFIHLSSIYDSMQRYVNQVKLECEQYGWEYVDGEFQANSEYRDVWHNLITQQCDVILCSICDNFDTYSDLVTEARQNGIGVYCVDNCTYDGIIANASCRCGIAAMELFYKVIEDYDYSIDFCVMSSNGASVLMQKHGPVVGILDNDAFPNMNLLALEDGSGADASAASDGYALTQAWMARYGDELDCVFTMFGNGGTAAAEAIAASGDTHGDNTFVCTFDDGPSVWAYIRQGTPLKYSYTHPYELYIHDLCTIMYQIQVQGMNPGDEGCLLEKNCSTLYYTGNILTADNVPQVGDSIHSAYDYYDAADTDAWYNYPGYLTVTD